MARPRLKGKKHEDPAAGQVEIPSVTALGKAIRQKRLAEGLSLAEAAPLCMVGIRFLSELERGKPGAELGKVLAVLRVLGLDLLLAPRAIQSAADAVTGQATGQGTGHITG